MKNKMIGIMAIVIIAILLVTVVYAETPWEIPWGDEDMVDGTITIDAFLICADGSEIKATNDLLAVFHSGVIVNSIKYKITLTATTTYDDLSYITLNFANQKIRSEHWICPTELIEDSSIASQTGSITFSGNTGSTVIYAFAPVAGTLQGLLDNNCPGKEGTWLVLYAPHGSFTWQAFDVNDNPISEVHTFTSDYNSWIVNSSWKGGFIHLTASGEGLVSFNWDINDPDYL